MHRNIQYRLFIGWVMMVLGLEKEIGVSGLAVHFVSKKEIWPSLSVSMVN
jgi:hypothetical protein